MDKQKNNQPVTAIVPCYNEGQRIIPVLQAIQSCSKVNEIIVVDDGSTDDTEKIVKNFSVIYIKNSTNLGKAQSMERGVNKAKNEIIFFSDADIIGLDKHIIKEIIIPVKENKVDMFVAILNRRLFFLHKLIPLVPILGGVRVVKKELWQKLPKFYKQKFRIETALNFYAKYYGQGFNIKLFKELDQTIKEKKYGYWQGLYRRLGMIADVTMAILKLQFLHLPKSVRNLRLLLGGILTSLLLIALGVVIVIAVQVGPLQFVLDIFANELRKDPDAPFVHWLINLVTQTSKRALLLAAYALITANVLAILLQINQFVQQLQIFGQGIKKLFSKTK